MKNEKIPRSIPDSPEIGILEWFHLNDREHVRQTVEKLELLGVKKLRTGVSWADYHTPEGEKWYDRLIPHLASHFEVLPCFLYTPPSLGIVPEITSPPKNPKAYADFLDVFINRHGQHFEYVELWNEPNNRSEYDYILDESWEIFCMMIIMAANWARHLGKKTVLGGISPIDPGWIKMMGERKVLEYIDVIGIHGFPDVFDSHWRSWDESIQSIQNALDMYDCKAEIWITETGYSTRFDERKQIEKFLDVLKTPVKRVYWYSLHDIPFHISTVDGHHIDEREYHFGMIHEDGTPKLLFNLWSSGGISNVVRNKWMADYKLNGIHKKQQPVLITGGAGFIGTNVADRLLKMGFPVYIYDNLSRLGVENNIAWLKSRHKSNLNIIIADTRDKLALEDAVNHVSHVFHFAAQVAVTTSLINPTLDYSVNVRGTINLLEAIRKSSHKPSLIFTSTNKVYGNLSDLDIRKDTTRYLLGNELLGQKGIDEFRRLDFYSPYGSSKGSADQYILDYARSFDLRNVVFRMSCIYGEHQFGTEDQGWVAHFILKALKNQKIILYGDGMQVRDILYVQDLVDAFLLAWKDIDRLSGEAFNMGGGPANTISLLELLSMIEEMTGNPVETAYDNWRKGDQKYYVSDFSKFTAATGWKPAVSATEGIEILFRWLSKNMIPHIPQGQLQKVV